MSPASEKVRASVCEEGGPFKLRKGEGKGCGEITAESTPTAEVKKSAAEGGDYCAVIVFQDQTLTYYSAA